MPEWLGEVKKTIEPIQSATSGIQNINSTVLETFIKFMEERFKSAKDLVE